MTDDRDRISTVEAVCYYYNTYVLAAEPAEPAMKSTASTALVGMCGSAGIGWEAI